MKENENNEKYTPEEMEESKRALTGCVITIIVFILLAIWVYS